VRLLRDLWATSPRSTAAVGLLIVVGALGETAAAALAGPVLVRHSWALFVPLAAALVVKVAAQLVLGLVTATLTADWTADVRRRLCRVAFGQPLPALDATPVGELLDRIDGDVSQVGSELRSTGVRLAQSVVVAAVSVVTATVLWWPAGLAMAALVAALGVVLRRRIGAIAPARAAEEEAWSDLAAVMEEGVHGQDDVRTTLARPYVLRLYARRASEVLARGRRVWQMSSVVTTAASLATHALIAGLVLGGAWALAGGRVDPARLTSNWLLAVAFGGTVEHVSRMLPDLQSTLGAWARTQLLAGSPQEPVGGSSPMEGDVEIRDLSFRYADGDRHGRRTVLSGVSLGFVRGRSYALVGRTGSGKSTLAKVLTRAVDVPRGTVRLAGTDLLDLDLEQLRRWVALVPQRTEILAGTLAENVALFDPALLGRAAGALGELGLDGWVGELPDGLETRLGDGGHVLSAGQEQLVAFARILVRDPFVVVLDEATARLDPATEARVQQATERLLRGRIGIVIAHRLSTVSRCDEVVVLADGRVLEAGPLQTSRRFADLVAAGRLDDEEPAFVPAQGGRDGAGHPDGGGGTAVAVREVVDIAETDAGHTRQLVAGLDVPVAAPDRAPAPPLPEPPPARTLREILRLVTNDARYGLGAVAVWTATVILGLDGSVLPVLWAGLVDGTGSLLWPSVGIVTALLVTSPSPYFTGRWFPEWWVRQMLRIGLRLVHGQTGPRRVSPHTPAEVVAQGGDTERVVFLADNMIDTSMAVAASAVMTLVSGTPVPAMFFLGTVLLSGAAASGFGPWLASSARRTVAARAAFATALVSSLSAARTVKLAGAARPVLAHLARLDAERSERQRREIAIQVWARSTPSMASGLLPIAAWALYLTGRLSAAGILVTVSTLSAASWVAWTTASLVSSIPSARVWTRRTVSMCGVAEYSAPVPGVDLSAGTAPAPPVPPRRPLRRLDLVGFGAVHEDGMVGVRDLDLTVERGQLVLVVGPVGSGKSSLLRALAGIVHHDGELRWNGEPVTEPEAFLRPNQVGYVGQLPRVLSGTVAENILLGHDVDPAGAVTTAQLDHDLAATGGGLGLLIGHKGTRLSGGQLQRLALARALAPQTELLVADDVSSALDVTTELALWQALRARGVTVVGSTSKRAALVRADRVVVLVGGCAVAQGTWSELEPRWSHLAG
jgi:ABC-type multidrug transport system fused ATPase/permease subunit